MIVAGFTLELQVWCKCILGTYFECEGVKCTCLSFYYLLTMETIVVQTSRSSPPNTWEHTWPIRNGSHAHYLHVQRFEDFNEGRDWQLLFQVLYFVNKCESMFSIAWFSDVRGRSRSLSLLAIGSVFYRAT